MSRSATIYTNARIVTMNPDQPRAEALAILDDRIVGVGTSHELFATFGSSTETVDLAGRTIVPGFHDCHMHILSYGLQLDLVDLSPDNVASIHDLRRLLAERAGTLPAGHWVRGRGYNHDFLAERRHPTRVDLDAVSRDQPVVVTHTSGHVLACNSVALNLAGIGGATPDPPGGEIDRGPSGEPTGVMKETAMPLVLGAVPPVTAETAQAAILRAMTALAREGITSASDAATGHDLSLDAELSAYRTAMGSGGLAGRITLMPEIGCIAHGASGVVATLHDFDVGGRPNWLRIGASKIFADGAITTRTSALRSPYLDSGDTGLPTWEIDELETMVERAHSAGWQIATHAMGDRAIEMVLGAYGKAQAASPRSSPRHRIEHCSLPDPRLCGRIKSLGVVPVMQPELLARFGDSYAEGLGGDWAANAMPVGWLRARDVPIGFSSDRPVVKGNPLFGIQSAMQRTTPTGVLLGGEHRVTFEQALWSYTVGAAYATFTEQDRGMLSNGYLADFTVLSADPTRIPAHEVADLDVCMTIVGGTVVYESSDSNATIGALS